MKVSELVGHYSDSEKGKEKEKLDVRPTGYRIAF